MKTLKVRFEDFWKDFNCNNNFITDILNKKYNLKILVNKWENPDILFYSNFGVNNILWKNCLRIYITGEADVPNFNFCDYAIGLVDIKFSDRYFRSKLYAFSQERLDEIKKRLNYLKDEDAFRRESFCYIVSNTSRDPIFFEFINKLEKYKPIKSGGKWNNNICRIVEDKYEFINNYKFNICFENCSIPGYVTEKIYEALLCRTIPIYWGTDMVTKDFNCKGIINISDFQSIEDAIEFIINLDTDYNLYKIFFNEVKNTHFITAEQVYQDISCFLFNSIEKGKKINLKIGVIGRLWSIYELICRFRINIIMDIYCKLKEFFQNTFKS